jgi:hypothetical protein
MWPAFFQNGDFRGSTDRLETQKADFAGHLAQRPLACQGAFSPRGRRAFTGGGPRVILKNMAQRPVILTGFHFTKTTLATLSESYEIAGHMDKPDPALVPAAAQPHVQALVTTGSVGASDALMAAMPRL